MPKKCTICEEAPAEFYLKGSSEFYCKECASSQFGDLGLLVAIEEKAAEIRRQIDEPINEEKEED